MDVFGTYQGISIYWNGDIENPVWFWEDISDGIALCGVFVFKGDIIRWTNSWSTQEVMRISDQDSQEPWIGLTKAGVYKLCYELGKGQVNDFVNWLETTLQQHRESQTKYSDLNLQTLERRIEDIEQRLINLEDVQYNDFISKI